MTTRLLHIVLACGILAGHATAAEGDATNARFLQRPVGGGDYVPIDVQGSVNTWSVMGYNGTGVLGALTLAQLLTNNLNAVTLSTHTTGNYVATIADSGTGEITVTGSGVEGAGVTLAINSVGGAKVGTGINAGNITTGTIGTGRLGSGTASASTYLRGDGTWSTPAGSGDVTAAANFGTDNRIIRSDGTGKGVKVSGIGIDNSNNVTGINNLTVTTLDTTNLNADGLFLIEEEGSGTHTLDVHTTSTLSTNRRLGFAVPDADIDVTFPGSVTVAGTTTVNNWADGIKQTFNPNATNAGINVGPHAGNPSTLVNGDLWYNTATAQLMGRINDANVALGAGGPGGSVASDTIWAAKGDLAAATGNDAATVLPVGTNGHVLTADSTTATGLRWAAASGGLSISSYKQDLPPMVEEFLGVLNSTSVPQGPLGLIAEGSGTGTGTAVAGDTSTIGFMQLSTSSANTGYRGLIAGGTAAASILFGGAAMEYQTRFHVAAPSNTAGTYNTRAGFMDSVSSTEPTDGVYFRQVGVHPVNLTAVCRQAGTETAQDTGVAFPSSGWLHLAVQVNAAANQAQFYVNGVLTNTITTNIPSGSGRNTSYGVTIYKTGTTADDKFITLDYMLLDVNLTSARP